MKKKGKQIFLKKNKNRKKKRVEKVIAELEIKNRKKDINKVKD